MHNTYMIGKYWSHIPGSKERETCTTCNTTESIGYIMTQCRDQTTQLIWSLARDLWLHQNLPWPEISLGTILSCGCISAQPAIRHNNEQRDRRTTYQGPTHLLQIILSESAYLIWTLQCERVIQEKHFHKNEIRNWWLRNINKRLTNDKITVTRIKRNDGFTNLVVNTWEPALRKYGDLPINWIRCSEVLVGRTA